MHNITLIIWFWSCLDLEQIWESKCDLGQFGRRGRVFVCASKALIYKHFDTLLRIFKRHKLWTFTFNGSTALLPHINNHWKPPTTQEKVDWGLTNGVHTCILYCYSSHKSQKKTRDYSFWQLFCLLMEYFINFARKIEELML